MTRVDFYILAEQTTEARYRFTCRLIDKAVSRGQNVYWHVNSHEEAKTLDNLLWDFRPESFVPHELNHADASTVHCPVHIGWSAPPQDHHDILINTSNRLPGFFSRFSRLMEVVTQTDDVLQYTRQHYRFLNERGYAIKHQDMRLDA